MTIAAKPAKAKHATDIPIRECPTQLLANRPKMIGGLLVT